jgi:hypothetical protein
MDEIELCSKCGIPKQIGNDLKWENNGVVSLTMSPRNRMVFYESGNIDNLFAGIEKLVGVPIEHMVIESRRRETRRYVERIYEASGGEAVELAREGMKEAGLPPDSAIRRELLELTRNINTSINNIGTVYGFGDIGLSEGWESGEEYPWRTQVIRHPYSLPLYAADMLGSVEAIENIDHCVEYRMVGEGTYEVTSSPGRHPIELKEMLHRRRYDPKPGDISYDSCPGCGVPLEITRCIWDLGGGTITDPENGRRMAVFGPSSLDAILGDLAVELGEEIPAAVIAAQRDYVKGYVGGENWNRDASEFRKMIASRGLGNLTRFEGGRQSLSLTIENSVLHLLMAGTIQAMVDMVYGFEESTCEWQLAEDGDLTVVVKGDKASSKSSSPGL